MGTPRGPRCRYPQEPSRPETCLIGRSPEGIHCRMAQAARQGGGRVEETQGEASQAQGFRAEEDKRLSMMKKEEEDRLRREIEDKKQREMEEKRRRMAEVEQKRQAAYKASKDKSVSPNFKVGTQEKKKVEPTQTGMDKFSNV